MNNDNPLRRIIANTKHFELLKDPRLSTFCLVNTMYLAMYVPMNFLPDALKKEHGVSSIKAGHVMAFYGISSTVGSLVMGVVTNYFEKCTLLLTVIFLAGCGSCCIGMAFSVGYWQHVVWFCFYGASRAIAYKMRPIVLVEMFGVDSLKFSYGILMFFEGFSLLVGGPLVGKLKVMSGRYAVAFMVTGGFYFVGAALALILIWLQKRKDNSNSEATAEEREIKGKYGST